MDAVVLTWRWQNIIAIWLMVALMYFFITIGSQLMLKFDSNKSA